MQPFVKGLPVAAQLHQFSVSILTAKIEELRLALFQGQQQVHLTLPALDVGRAPYIRQFFRKVRFTQDQSALLLSDLIIYRLPRLLGRCEHPSVTHQSPQRYLTH